MTIDMMKDEKRRNNNSSKVGSGKYAAELGEQY
jgi:hypothetical protein